MFATLLSWNRRALLRRGLGLALAGLWRATCASLAAAHADPIQVARGSVT